MSSHVTDARNGEHREHSASHGQDPSQLGEIGSSAAIADRQRMAQMFAELKAALRALPRIDRFRVNRRAVRMLRNDADLLDAAWECEQSNAVRGFAKVKVTIDEVVTAVWGYRQRCERCSEQTTFCTYRGPKDWLDRYRLKRGRVCARCRPEAARDALRRHRADQHQERADHQCHACGNAFEARRAYAKTCSARCRKKLSRRGQS